MDLNTEKTILTDRLDELTVEADISLYRSTIQQIELLMVGELNVLNELLTKIVMSHLW
jgi:hypothetical protein